MTVDSRIRKVLADAQRARDELRNAHGELEKLRGGGGGGTSDGMDHWQQSVETRLGELRGDIRQVLQVSIGGVVLLLCAFATGYLILSARMDAATEKVSSKIDALTAQISQQSERLARLEVKPASPPDAK